MRLSLAHAAGYSSLRRRNLTLDAPRDPFAGLALSPAALGAHDVVLALGALWAGSGKHGAIRREHLSRTVDVAISVPARKRLQLRAFLERQAVEFYPEYAS
jgi:hypothetical protein